MGSTSGMMSQCLGSQYTVIENPISSGYQYPIQLPIQNNILQKRNIIQDQQLQRVQPLQQSQQHTIQVNHIPMTHDAHMLPKQVSFIQNPILSSQLQPDLTRVIASETQLLNTSSLGFNINPVTPQYSSSVNDPKFMLQSSLPTSCIPSVLPATSMNTLTKTPIDNMVLNHNTQHMVPTSQHIISPLQLGVVPNISSNIPPFYQPPTSSSASSFLPASYNPRILNPANNISVVSTDPNLTIFPSSAGTTAFSQNLSGGTPLLPQFVNNGYGRTLNNRMVSSRTMLYGNPVQKSGSSDNILCADFNKSVPDLTDLGSSGTTLLNRNFGSRSALNKPDPQISNTLSTDQAVSIDDQKLHPKEAPKLQPKSNIAQHKQQAIQRQQIHENQQNLYLKQQMQREQFQKMQQQLIERQLQVSQRTQLNEGSQSAISGDLNSETGSLNLTELNRIDTMHTYANIIIQDSIIYSNNAGSHKENSLSLNDNVSFTPQQSTSSAAGCTNSDSLKRKHASVV